MDCILEDVRSVNQNGETSSSGGSTSLSSQSIKPLFSHQCIAVILYLCLELSKQCLIVVVVLFIISGPCALWMDGFDKSGRQRCDFRVARDESMTVQPIDDAFTSSYLSIRPGERDDCYVSGQITVRDLDSITTELPSLQLR